MTVASALVRFLIFPGLLFAVPAAWFVLWLERKAVAVMQQRIGPPFMQPFWDFVKLMAKSAPPRHSSPDRLMMLWPLLAVAAGAGAVGLLPVLPQAGGFAGDLILLLALLELPSMCLIAAGFSSRSIFAEIGSVREAMLSISYNVLFLMALISIAATQHSFRIDSLGQLPSTPLRWLGVAAILICLPGKLHLNPFSIPNAEQEIYAGPLTEYAGPELALWELAHGLEWIAAIGVVATLVLPHGLSATLTGISFVGITLLIVLLLSFLAASSARLAIDASVRFYIRCAVVFAVLAALSLAWVRFHV